MNEGDRRRRKMGVIEIALIGVQEVLNFPHRKREKEVEP